MSSYFSDLELTQLLDRLETWLRPVFPGPADADDMPSHSLSEDSSNKESRQAPPPEELEEFLNQLPGLFISAVKQAEPPIVSASLERLDHLMSPELRRAYPTLYGVFLGLRPFLAAAVSGFSHSQDGHDDLEPIVAAEWRPGSRPLSESVSELFRWAGYGVEAVDPEDGNLLRVALTSGPMAIHGVVRCLEHLPDAAEIRALADRVEDLRLAEQLPFRGVLVARAGDEPLDGPSRESIEATAREYRVELTTEDLLLYSLIDMEAAAEVARRPFQASGLGRGFVDPEMVLEAEPSREPRSLSPWVGEWLDSDSRALLLLGDFGLGKTTFCRHLAARLADEWRPGRRLPVLIDLREHTTLGLVSPQALIARHFRRAGVRVADPAALMRLCYGGSMVLILDGFGEMVTSSENQAHLGAVRDLLSFAKGRAKVVLTCRSHYFRDPEVVNDEGARAPVEARSDSGLLMDEVRSRRDVEIASIRELDASRIDLYLQQVVPDDLQRYRELLANSYHLENLARRPFLLRMIVEALPRIESGRDDASLAGLYESYCGDWLRPESRAPVGLKDREALLEDLARRLWGSSRERVDHRKLTPSWSSPSDEGDLELQAVDQALRRAPFLHRDRKGFYGFVHRSFLEFFLGRSLRRGLASGKDQALDLPPITREVAFFLECWPEATRIPELAGRVLAGPYRSRVSENALLLLMFHARAKVGPLLGPGAEDVEAQWSRKLPDIFSTLRPTGLNLQGADFSGMDLRALDLAAADLREAKLRGTDLRDGRFDGSDLMAADLRGADLRRARLEGTALEQADLRQADLRQADLRLARCARADFREARIDELVVDGASFLATRGLPQSLLGSSVEVSPVFQSGHSWRICDVAWHPELPLIASAAEDGTVLIWNVAGNRLLRRLSGHGRAVNAVNWAGDGRRLATGSDDRTVRIWDAESGELLHVLEGHQSGVSDVSWGSDQRLASVSEDHTLRIWDSSTGRCAHVLEGHSDRINCVAWDISSNQLATGSDDWTVRLWDVQSGAALGVLAGHSDGVHALDWSPEGRRLASGSDDWTVRIWNPETGQNTRTLSGHSEGVHAVVWHPSGERLASGAFDRSIRLWAADTGRALDKLEGHSGWVRALSWSPSGRRLASGASSRAVRLWDVEGRRSTHRLAGFAGWINTVAWSPDGRRLAAGSSGRIVRIWNREDGSSRALQGHEDRVHTVAWDPSGRRVASGADDRTVRIWDLESGETEHVLEGHAGWIRAVVWDPEGKRLASGADDRIVRVWEAASGTCLRTFDGHSGWVRALAWDPANRYLASGADDGTVKLWHVDSGQQTHTLGGHGAWVLSVAWDPAGRRLASGTGDGQVRIWDSEAGRKLHQLEGHQSWIHTVAWNESGDRLLSASVDGLIRISDPQTGECLQTLEAGFIWHAAWSGDRLALAVPEGRIALWRLQGLRPKKVADFWGAPEGGLVVTEEGYVDGDPEALEQVRFVDDGWAVYELSELSDRHNPERVRRLLQRA